LKTLKIRIGSLEFVARLEEEKAPRTCAAFGKLLPFRKQAIHARWSGEAAWVPLGDLQLGVGYENHTSHPGPGQLLFYPGGLSEAEILIPYGSTCFSSRVGQLAGNHFLTMLATAESLAEIGRLVLWKGAQDVVFEL
jgi:hypothetical protein